MAVRNLGVRQRSTPPAGGYLIKPLGRMKVARANQLGQARQNLIMIFDLIRNADQACSVAARSSVPTGESTVWYATSSSPSASAAITS
jgi:hypothetical protein